MAERHSVAELKAEILERAEGTTWVEEDFTRSVWNMSFYELAVALVDALERESNR